MLDELTVFLEEKGFQEINGHGKRLIYSKQIKNNQKLLIRFDKNRLSLIFIENDSTEHYNSFSIFASRKFLKNNALTFIDFLEEKSKDIFQFINEYAIHNSAFMSFYFTKSVKELSSESFGFMSFMPIKEKGLVISDDKALFLSELPLEYKITIRDEWKFRGQFLGM